MTHDEHAALPSHKPTDNIIRMAREAGLYVGTNLSGVQLVGHEYLPGSVLVHLDVEDLRKFAVIVAAAEREAIAKMFDGEVWAYDYREIAAAIRARGGE